jgi:hypothetical protein
MGDGHCGTFQPGAPVPVAGDRQDHGLCSRVSTAKNHALSAGSDRPYAICPDAGAECTDSRATSCCRHYAYAVPYSRYASVCVPAVSAPLPCPTQKNGRDVWCPPARTSRRDSDRMTCIVASPRLARLQVLLDPRRQLWHVERHDADGFRASRRRCGRQSSCTRWDTRLTSGLLGGEDAYSARFHPFLTV